MYNRIYDKVTATINTTKGVKGSMLRKAYATKVANLRKNILNHPFWCGAARPCGACLLALSRIVVALPSNRAV